MKPFVLDEAEEFRCFNSLLKGSAEQKINLIVFNFAVKIISAWPYNFNYWTGGSRVDLPRAPKWCSLEKTISLSNITLVGQRNVSYEGKDCVAFQLTKVTNNITSNFSSFMTMRNCSARQMIACRVWKN